MLCFNFTSCNQEEVFAEKRLVDNSENINKLIKSFNFALKKSIQDKSLNNDQLGSFFIDESKRQGLKIINTQDYSAKKSTKNNEFSEKYKVFSEAINSASNNLSKNEYKTNLVNLKEEILNSNISIEEKQLLVDNTGFLIAFVDWMEDLNQLSSKSEKLKLKSDCDGWWSCWGKCVAGTIGGALTGGIEGCGIGGAIGAVIGGIAVNPITVATGAIYGCAAGGGVGIIGGGLSGAASSC